MNHIKCASPSFQITENGPLVGAVGSIAAAGISWLGDVAIMREVRHQTAYLQKQIDELDLQVRWLTTAVKILQAAANKENEACAVIETLANQVWGEYPYKIKDVCTVGGGWNSLCSFASTICVSVQQPHQNAGRWAGVD